VALLLQPCIMMKWITTLCGLVVVGAVTLSAQSPDSTTASVAAASSPAFTPPPTETRALVSPQQYLEDGQRMLAGRDEKKFSRLQNDFSSLVSRYADAQGATAWTSSFSDVERDIVRLMDGSALSLGRIQDPAATQVGLDAFRTQIELFYDAATTTSAVGRTAARSATLPAAGVGPGAEIVPPVTAAVAPATAAPLQPLITPSTAPGITPPGTGTGTGAATPVPETIPPGLITPGTPTLPPPGAVTGTGTVPPTVPGTISPRTNAPATPGAGTGTATPPT